jgi:dolichol-phosphate mannosyltransferase
MSNKKPQSTHSNLQPQTEQFTSPTTDCVSHGTGVSIIIPTYNERENVNEVIAECLKALPPETFDLEVIIVDDDSDDYTWQYPARLYGDDPRVRVIRRESANRGLGESVVDGFASASHDFCAVIDADLQHPPDKLPALFDALDNGADIAIGSRHVSGGGIENWPLWRKVVSKGATACARVGLPDARGVSDPMSGFFAIRRSVIEDIDLNPQGYKILLEVLGKGNYQTITEVPYQFRERERGESKLTADEYQNFLEHVGQLSVANRNLDDVVEPKRAVRGAEFGFVGATGSVLNMVVFMALTSQTDLFFLAAGLIAFVVAVNWNFAGNWLVTYDRPSGDLLKQYTLFHTVSVVGLVAYSATLTVAAFVGLPLLLANLLAILTGAGVNFFGTETSVFSRNTTSSKLPNAITD